MAIPPNADNKKQFLLLLWAKRAVRHKNPWLAGFLLRHMQRLHQVQKRFRAGAYALQCVGQARSKQVRQGLRLSRRRKQLLVSTVTGTTLLLASVAPALAGTIGVTTTNDAINGSDGCSLREAIVAANNNAAYSDCIISGTPGNDTVDLTALSGSIVLSSTLSTLPTISETLQINGPGAAALTVDGNGSSAVITSSLTANTVGIDGLTINNAGYGVYAYNDATVTDSVITGTDVGVVADNATVSNSTITGDIYSGVYAYTQAKVTNSTVTGGNYGVYSLGDALISNSTVTGQLYAGVFALDSGTVTNNSVVSGYGFGMFTAGNAVVSGSQVINNTYGIIALNALTVANSVVNGSYLGTYAYAQTTVTNSTITGEAGIKSYGNAIVSNSSSITGTADNGVDSYSNVVVRDSTVTGYVYGVYSYTGYATVSGSTVTGSYDDGVSTYTDATVTDSTISGGDDGVDANAGDISVSNSVVSGADDGLDARYSIAATNNSAVTGVEYGIYAHYGSATVHMSTVTGGSLYDGVYAGTHAQVSYSTITGGRNGMVVSNTVTLTNSTVSSSGRHGVESLAGGAITINHSTIANNSGYGVVTNGGTTEVNNSIIAGNGGLGSTRDINGTISTGTYNLIGNGDGSGLTNGVNGNLLGSTGALLDAQLRALQDNGGFTPTHLPEATSPAVDAGDPTFSSPPNFDQRGTGFARVLFGTLDMGAVERQLLLFYFPFIAKTNVSLPDLVITNITATSSDVLVTLKNQGDAPVTDAFWVDIYYDLSTPPSLNQQGSLFWGLSVANSGVPIAAGKSVTLSLASSTYFEGSPPGSGTKVYGQVDSVGRAGVGGVVEANEGNNVFGAVTSTSGAAASSPTPQSALDRSGLPDRAIVTLSPANSLTERDYDSVRRQGKVDEQDDSRDGQGWQASLRAKSLDKSQFSVDKQQYQEQGGGHKGKRNARRSQRR